MRSVLTGKASPCPRPAPYFGVVEFPLLALELVGLSIIKREAEHIALGVFVYLELDEAVWQRAESFGHRRKSPDRHKRGRENFAVPGLKCQLGTGRRKLHDQRIAFQHHRCFAHARIAEIA